MISMGNKKIHSPREIFKNTYFNWNREKIDHFLKEMGFCFLLQNLADLLPMVNLVF